jgi:cyclomaltodextrinase / maltogenic alpha-amylase / neopullulanase
MRIGPVPALLALAAATFAVADAFPPAVPAAKVPREDAPGALPPSVSAERAVQGGWSVTFRFRPGRAAKSVVVAGDFNNWNRTPGPASMARQADGSWQATVRLEEGTRLYKFVLDGSEWVPDPLNPAREPDGQGGFNSVLRLGAEHGLDASAARRGDGRIDPRGLRHEPARLNYLERGPTAWTIRYRTLAGDAEQVAFVARDGRHLAMERAGRLGPFDFWQVSLPVGGPSTDYTFVIQDGTMSVRDPQTYSLDTNRIPGFRTPDWAKNAIWYQIMVDRFRNGSAANDLPTTRDWRQEWYEPSAWEGQDGQTFYNHFVFKRQCGGDLQGLRQQLPYLKSLGVNALYLLPVFQAESNHKYNATNYVHVDERIGAGGDYEATEAKEDLLDARTWTFNASDREFLAFLKEAKGMGFRVILDGVWNHVGTRHPAFRDVQAKGRDSRFADWFSVKSWEPFDYEGWFGFGELPTFRKSDEHGLASEAVRRHIYEVTRRWMDPDGDGDPSDGIDGWRLDVANEIPMPFWHEWCKFVRSINPEAYITGEIWHRADPWLDGRSFDAVMNYEFAKPSIRWVIDRRNKLTPSQLDAKLAELRMAYPTEITYVMQNLLDSHDTDRVASMSLNPDREYNNLNREQEVQTYDASKPGAEHFRRVRLLALLQMTYVGAPMIWYGTEVGMWGSGDPNNRKPMLWKDLQPYAVPGENAVMEEQLDFYRRAIALRNAHPALRTGSFRTVVTDDAQDTWVFLREGGGEQVLVALNAGDKPATLDLPASLGSGWKPAFGEAPTNVPDSAFPRVEVPPVAGRVWVRKTP